jgi:hypothetical protein
MSSVVETRCGTGWFDATNTSLRCQNSVVETQCGIGWYVPSASLRCQNNVVERLGLCENNEWHDITKPCPDPEEGDEPLE